jgi:hypothetical protein
VRAGVADARIDHLDVRPGGRKVRLEHVAEGLGVLDHPVGMAVARDEDARPALLDLRVRILAKAEVVGADHDLAAGVLGPGPGLRDVGLEHGPGDGVVHLPRALAHTPEQLARRGLVDDRALHVGRPQEGAVPRADRAGLVSASACGRRRRPRPELPPRQPAQHAGRGQQDEQLVDRRAGHRRDQPTFARACTKE